MDEKVMLAHTKDDIGTIVDILKKTKEYKVFSKRLERLAKGTNIEIRPKIHLTIAWEDSCVGTGVTRESEITSSVLKSKELKKAVSKFNREIKRFNKDTQSWIVSNIRQYSKVQKNLVTNLTYHVWSRLFNN